MICGPPAAGESTWIRNKANHGDVVIDLEALTGALTVASRTTHEQQPHLVPIALDAREAAIKRALPLVSKCDVYLIHSFPDLSAVQGYLSHGAQFVVVDPGQAVVLRRIEASRPLEMRKVAGSWYGLRANALRAALHREGHFPIKVSAADQRDDLVESG